MGQPIGGSNPLVSAPTRISPSASGAMLPPAGRGSPPLEDHRSQLRLEAQSYVAVGTGTEGHSRVEARNGAEVESPVVAAEMRQGQLVVEPVEGRGQRTVADPHCEVAVPGMVEGALVVLQLSCWGDVGRCGRGRWCG